MPELANPREVLAHLLRGIADRAWYDLPDLCAEDAVVEQLWGGKTSRGLVCGAVSWAHA